MKLNTSSNTEEEEEEEEEEEDPDRRLSREAEARDFFSSALK